MDNATYMMLEQLFDTKLALLAEKMDNNVVIAVHTMRKELVVECAALVTDSITTHTISCEGPKLAKSWKWLVRTLIVVLLTVGIAAIYKTFLG